MIKIIGLSKSVYAHILSYYDHMIKYCDNSCSMIEFIPQCCLELSHGSVSIDYENDSINILCCDYWRIEIE